MSVCRGSYGITYTIKQESLFYDRPSYLSEVSPDVHDAERDDARNRRRHDQEEREDQSPREGPEARFFEIVLDDGGPLREIDDREDDCEVPARDPHCFSRHHDEGQRRD